MVYNGSLYVSEYEWKPVGGKRPYAIWKMNLKSRERSWVLQEDSGQHTFSNFWPTPRKVFVSLSGSGRPEQLLSWSEDKIAVLENGNPLRDLITFREYASYRKHGSRTCGEDLSGIESAANGGYVISTSVRDQDALPDAGCDETGSEVEPWRTFFRWYSATGNLERLVKFSQADPQTEPTLFAGGSGVLEAYYARWRVTNLNNGRSRTFKTTRFVDIGSVALAGSDRSVLSMNTISRNGRRSRYAIAYFPDPLRSRRWISVKETTDKALYFGYCGRSVIFTDSKMTRLYRWSNKTHRTRLIASAPARQTIGEISCDDKDAVVWLENKKYGYPDPSKAKYIQLGR